MRIVFFGDSITDFGRDRSNGLIGMGQGYPLLVTASLSLSQPGQHSFLNRGVSGNSVLDLYARVKQDVWNRAPELLSILIGINGVWHDLEPEPYGVDAARYETVYRMLLQETIARFPDIRLMILEPFVLRTGAAVEAWETFHAETALRAASARKAAEEAHAVFVPLQRVFDDACRIQPPSYWLADGVHPTPAGHQLIANEWLRAFEMLRLRDGNG